MLQETLPAPEKAQPEKDKQEFSVGQVVWAKLDGFPWWPARIANITEAPPSVKENLHPRTDHILVYFFGDHNFAYLRENKIQPFTEKQSERIQNVKIKNFRVALQESQIWLNSQSTTPPNMETHLHFPMEHSTELPSSTQGSSSNLPATNPQPVQIPPVPSPTIDTQNHPPSPLFINTDPPDHPPEQGAVAVADIPLSSELAKIWDYVEVDEDTVDGFVIISSEKDMNPVVAFYNEHKRKLGVHTTQISPKRVKTSESPTFSTPNKAYPRAEPPNIHGTVPRLHTTPTFIPYTHISAPPASTAIYSPHYSTLPPTSQGLKDTIQRHKFTGAATNGFTTVPLQGTVEGSEEGLHVEFVVQGHTYRGFLLARESFPALVSPLVPPSMSTSYSSLSPYVNLAKLTAMAVTKQHHERLVELGRLVVASAMVPYAYPPPLHL